MTKPTFESILKTVIVRRYYNAGYSIKDDIAPAAKMTTAQVRARLRESGLAIELTDRMPGTKPPRARHQIS